MKAIFAVAGLAVFTWLAGCAMDDTTPSSEPSDQVGTVQAATIPDGWTAVDASSDTDGTVVVTADSTSLHGCPDGFACLFQNGKSGGFSVAVKKGGGVKNLKSVSCSVCTDGTNGNDGTFNDQMSSWANNSDVDFCWFADAGYSGATHLMVAGGSNTVPSEYNDHASSFRSGKCSSN